MIRAMYNGTSGLLAAQQGLSTTSNNIANSQTTGFKKQDVFYEDVFYQSLKSPSAGTSLVSGTNPSDVGNGVQIASIKTNFSTGPITATGGKLDAAIEGSGFFIVGNARGEDLLYTKAGNFNSSVNNELITQQGLYVMGWNADETTGLISTVGSVQPIKVPVGEVGKPKQTTQITLQGNLNREDVIGTATGTQVKTYDSLGVSHNVDINFVKTSQSEYKFIAIPNDQFKESGTIKNAIFNVNEGNINKIQKGDYELTTSDAGGGMVNVEVKDPSGNVVFTDTITNNKQTINIGDADSTWFTIDYEKGTHGTATVTVGEVGTTEFDAVGNMLNATGSGAGGKPEITFKPAETGVTMNIDLDITGMTSLATDNNILLKGTDGYGSSTLMSYSITDGGQIQGEYNDGSVRVIAQLAMASFSNELGLTREGSGLYRTTPTSGEPDIGMPATGQRSNIKAQALEGSNVDLAEEFVGLITDQKFYQGNSKVITVSQDVLDTVINLIR